MSAAHTAFRSTKYFASLDGLRCISILAVVWHHGPGYNAPGLAGSGLLGVQLFFAISGFLITTLLLREKERHGEISLRNFYIRRSLRIFPLYYTILAAYGVLVTAFGGQTPRESGFYANLPYFVTYTSNWFVPTSAVFGFAWSLATEEQFYLCWPSVERFGKGHWAVLVMAALLAGTSVHYVLSNPNDVSLPNQIVRSIAAPICWGVLLAHLFHSQAGFAAAWRITRYRGSSLACLALLMASIQFAVSHFVTYFLMAAMVGCCVAREDHWLAPVLRSKPFAHIGMISYGMYLFHGLCYNIVQRAGTAAGAPAMRHTMVEFVLSAAVTTAVATVSYRLYESRFLRLKSRFSGD